MNYNLLETVMESLPTECRLVIEECDYGGFWDTEDLSAIEHCIIAFLTHSDYAERWDLSNEISKLRLSELDKWISETVKKYRIKQVV